MENTSTKTKIVQSLFTSRRKSFWSAWLCFPFYLLHQYFTSNCKIIYVKLYNRKLFIYFFSELQREFNRHKLC